MKKFLLLCILACVGLGTAAGQEKGLQAGIWYQRSTNTPFSEKFDFNSADLVISLGYSFNGRLALRIPFTFAAELYRLPAKTYNTNVLIGGSISYDVLAKEWGRIEIAGTAGGTVTRNTPQYVYYDLGAYLNLGRRTKFSVGLGVRQYQSTRSSFKSYTTMYGSIGCRFN